MRVTFEYLSKFKTSNRIFEGRNVSLEATKILNEQKYKIDDLCCQQRRKTFGRFHQAA